MKLSKAATFNCWCLRFTCHCSTEAQFKLKPKHFSAIQQLLPRQLQLQQRPNTNFTLPSLSHISGQLSCLGQQRSTGENLLIFVSGLAFTLLPQFRVRTRFKSSISFGRYRNSGGVRNGCFTCAPRRTDRWELRNNWVHEKERPWKITKDLNFCVSPWFRKLEANTALFFVAPSFLSKLLIQCQVSHKQAICIHDLVAWKCCPRWKLPQFERWATSS